MGLGKNRTTQKDRTTLHILIANVISRAEATKGGKHMRTFDESLDSYGCAQKGDGEIYRGKEEAVNAIGNLRALLVG